MNPTLTNKNENSVNIVYIHEENQQYKRGVVSLIAKGDIVIPIVLLTGIVIGWITCSSFHKN